METAMTLPPRVCLREPITEIEASAQLLSAAVDQHLAGNVIEAARLIEEANSPIVRAWTEPGTYGLTGVSSPSP